MVPVYRLSTTPECCLLLSCAHIATPVCIRLLASDTRAWTSITTLVRTELLLLYNRRVG
jgi:hypothetical protein